MVTPLGSCGVAPCVPIISNNAIGVQSSNRATETISSQSHLLCRKSLMLARTDGYSTGAAVPSTNRDFQREVRRKTVLANPRLQRIRNVLRFFGASITGTAAQVRQRRPGQVERTIKRLLHAVRTNSHEKRHTLPLVASNVCLLDFGD